jgi:hypothetical protein
MIGKCDKQKKKIFLIQRLGERQRDIDKERQKDRQTKEIFLIHFSFCSIHKKKHSVSIDTNQGPISETFETI